MKPYIGVLTLYNQEEEKFYMIKEYMEAIAEAGGIPVILPLTNNKAIISQLAGLFDGFLFTGGEDIQPALYSEKETFSGNLYNPKRDEMESLLLRQILVRNKPLLGICRGHQLLNVVLGGNLYQDLAAERKSHVLHHQKDKKSDGVHSVSLVKGEPLAKLLREEEIEVNSLHHQAVKEISKLLKPMAYSEDGLVEAAYEPSKKFVWSVQWHPELTIEWDSSQKIFRAFIDSCSKH